MRSTVWLASYPKSGNTWFRMLVAGLSSADGAIDINDLPERNAIASARAPFDHWSLIDSGLLTHDEADCLRPRVLEHLASLDQGEDDPTAAAVHFAKVHDAYTLSPKGEALLAGRRGASGVIVIVRDPRDVAPSLANHHSSTIDEAIAFMADGGATYSAHRNRRSQQFRQLLPGWGGHVASWLDQQDLPVHLVRYEDLLADTAGVFARALAFAGRTASPLDVDRAVSRSGFAELRRQERENGFRESPPRLRYGAFFRRGEAGAWREELTPEQVARIEGNHGETMRRLGYPLSLHSAASQ